MRFRVLGALEVRDADGTWRALSSPNQGRVLATLLARAGDVVTVGALVEAVWGDDPPETAVPTLRTYLSRLRPLVGEALVSRGQGYRLELAPGELDAAAFDDLVRAAAAAPPAQAVAHLDEALALWRGDAFGDHADVAGVRAEARRLEEGRRAAAETRAGALLRSGRAAEAVAAAEAMVAQEPLREGAWVVLIGALAATGRQAEALRAYARAADALADAGLSPSARLRQAERDVLDGAATPEPPVSSTVRLPPPPARRSEAPAPRSSFVGRDDERDQLVALLDRTRLVSLVGPGGVGKTRLAIEVARLAGQRRSLGAAMVELAALDHDHEVVAAMAAALGLAPDDLGDAPLAAVGHLDLLVLVDNAEHVVDAAAAAVDQLLRRGDGVRVLVTSREPLGVDGEHVWSVSPLPTAGPIAAAGQLFVDRGRAVCPDLHLSTDDPLVAAIAHRLDGLPLAIEMAAAQLPSTGLAELAALLDEPVVNLQWRRRDVSPRHRSLANVLAWSESRLSPVEASVLAELSVFAGAVPAVDVVGVLGRPDAAEVVRSLVERSLVVLDRSAEPPRFRLLQTVRHFAAGRLDHDGRSRELAHRHARWFTDVARVAAAQLLTAEEGTGHHRLSGAVAELRAAHRWAVAHDLDLAAELSAQLHHFAQTRQAHELLAWAAGLVDAVAPDHPRRPDLLASAATLALNRGDLAEGRRLASAAVAQAGDGAAVAHALEALGDAAVYDGRLDEGMAAGRRLTEVALAHDLPGYYRVMGRGAHVLTAGYAGSPRPALLAGLDEVAAAAVDPTSRAWLAYFRGELLADDDPGAALAAFAEAVAVGRSVGSRFVDGVALVSWSSLLARVGDLGVALSAMAEVVQQWIEVADRTHQLTALRNLAMLCERAGAPEPAAELLGAVRRDDIPSYGDEARRLDAVAGWATEQLGVERFATLAAEGARLDVTDAAARALALIAALRVQLA